VRVVGEVFPKVRVQRHLLKPGKWLVTCQLCGGDLGFLAGFFGKGIKGFANDWQTAQEYAQRHAMAHEATRCATCLHIPARPLPEEARR
jgi:hypothetical protein